MARYGRDTDYLYGSARVRALESRLADRERVERMLAARSVGEIVAMLPDLGFTLRYGGADGKELLREETLLSILEDGYRELEEMDGGRGLCRFLRYPYDCNNAKVIIKCAFRGIDPDRMLFDGIGTLSKEEIKSAFAEKRFGALPSEMARAIPEAEERFAATGNPGWVDWLLDGACYGDMLRAAEKTGVPYAVELVKTRIDTVNLLNCLRLIRKGWGRASRELFRRVFLGGGTLTEEFLADASEKGETALSERLLSSDDRALASLAEGERAPLRIIEKRADELCLLRAAKSQYVPFGAEVLLGYAVLLEYEVKNLRILLAGKDAGLPPEVIRERLRRNDG